LRNVIFLFVAAVLIAVCADAKSETSFDPGAVLFEEDLSSQGSQHGGTSVWQNANARAPSDPIIMAKVTIPERQMNVTWSLQRNTDPRLTATHVVEIKFDLPVNFSHGNVANVPGMLMKASLNERGAPIAGLSVKVTPGYFMIGLSAVKADVESNRRRLTSGEWMDIPIVFDDGHRAILAIQKGPSGDSVFNAAFAAWESAR
jgi:hypothetical protein